MNNGMQGIDYKHKIAFNSIITGFFFFYLGGIPDIFIYGLNFTFLIGFRELLKVLFCLIGWYFVLKGWTKLRPYMRFPVNGYYHFLYVLYVIVVFFMILRGYMIDYEYQWPNWMSMINFHLFSSSYILCYFMMFFVFVPLKAINLKKYIKYSTYAAFLMIVFSLLGWRTMVMQSVQHSLGYEIDDGSPIYAIQAAFFAPFAFACFCRPYINKKEWNIAIVGFVFYLLTLLITARRGGSIIALLMFVYIFYIWSKSQNGRTRVLSTAFMFVILAVAVNLIMQSSILDYLINRGMEDSRSAVDDALMAQMTPLQKVFGKGLNGRYYFYLPQEELYNGWRYLTETGFYNLVLKGGYVMAFLHIIVLAIPSILGMFKSQNLFCKSLGFYIFLSLVDLYPHGHLSFNFRFLIIWLGVAICLNKRIRQMNDIQIKDQFF